MNTYETQGYYGSQHTPCRVLVAQHGAHSWYCVAGGVNVNLTYNDIRLGVDVETLADVNGTTASQPINTEEDLINHIEA